MKMSNSVHTCECQYVKCWLHIKFSLNFKIVVQTIIN